VQPTDDRRVEGVRPAAEVHHLGGLGTPQLAAGPGRVDHAAVLAALHLGLARIGPLARDEVHLDPPPVQLRQDSILAVLLTGA
jgi:hypothetical protein